MEIEQTKARVEWIVFELIQSGMDEIEVKNFFQECIDKVKKENLTTISSKNKKISN